jgi:predicted aspartyl protease
MDMQEPCVVKFRNVSNLPFVRAKIEEKQYSGFVIDTGSNCTAIDQGLAIRLGLIDPPDPDRPPRGTYVYGVDKIRAETVVIPSLTIGDCVVKGLMASALNLSGSRMDFGVRVNGIIGQDFLKRYEVTIDYRSNLLTFRPPNKGLAYQKDRQYETYFIPCRFAIPSRIRPIEPLLGIFASMLGIPPIIIVEGRYERTRLRFLVDTGAATEIVLFSGTVARMRLPLNAKRLKIIGPIGSGIGGDLYGYYVRLPSIWIGSLEIPDPEIMVTEGKDMLSPYVDGIVGGNIFCDFLFTINYKRRIIRLVRTPPKRTRRVGEVGIGVIREDKRFVVGSIIENSSAHKAGVKLDDEIVSVDGLPLQGLLQARRLLRGKPGSKVKVVLLRGEKPIQVTLQRWELDDYLM